MDLSYSMWRMARSCCTEARSSAELLSNTSLVSAIYPPAAGPSSASLPIAIATAHRPGIRRNQTQRLPGCGIVKWCRSTIALSRLPVFASRAEVAILTNNASWVREECVQPGVRIIPPDLQLERLMSAWANVSKPGKRGGKHSRPSRPDTLMKWQLVSLTQYAAVLYMDLDVDLGKLLLPASAGAAAGEAFAVAWLQGYEAFVSTGTRLIASRDPDVPINTAVMLLRPDESVYSIGLAVLSQGRFNYTHGFNLTGRPRDVLPALRGADLRRVRDNRMWRVDTWDVVCGDADQGLFAHVFLVALRGVGFAYPSRDDRARVHHFFGMLKPWGKQARCLEYLAFLSEPSGNGSNGVATVGTSYCQRKLEEKRGCLMARTLPPGMARDRLCSECERGGQRNTCPKRRWLQAPAGGTTAIFVNGTTPFCPNLQTRWWLL